MNASFRYFLLFYVFLFSNCFLRAQNNERSVLDDSLNSTQDCEINFDRMSLDGQTFIFGKSEIRNFRKYLQNQQPIKHRVPLDLAMGPSYKITEFRLEEYGLTLFFSNRSGKLKRKTLDRVKVDSACNCSQTTKLLNKSSMSLDSALSTNEWIKVNEDCWDREVDEEKYTFYWYRYRDESNGNYAVKVVSTNNCDSFIVHSYDYYYVKSGFELPFNY